MAASQAFTLPDRGCARSLPARRKKFLVSRFDRFDAVATSTSVTAVPAKAHFCSMPSRRTHFCDAQRTLRTFRQGSHNVIRIVSSPLFRCQKRCLLLHLPLTIRKTLCEIPAQATATIRTVRQDGRTKTARAGDQEARRTTAIHRSGRPRTARSWKLLAESPGLGVTEIARRMGASESARLPPAAHARAARLCHSRPGAPHERARLPAALPRRCDRPHQISSSAPRHEHLDELALAQPRGRQPVHSRRARPPSASRRGHRRTKSACSPHIGRHGPLHVGGGSNVLLAYAPQDIQDTRACRRNGDSYAVHADRSDEARQRLHKSERDGYHSSRATMSTCPPSRSACPSGATARSSLPPLSLAGTINRLTPETEAHHRKLLLDYAGQMSRGSAVRNWRERAAAARLAVAS